jgi:hypothetical protein
MTRARVASWSVGAAAAMCAGAMLAYPGGTILDPGTSRYELTQNFLSDLGMTVAYGGGSNRIGATLFVASMLTLLAVAGTTFRPLMSSLLRIPGSRHWAGAAATCVLLTCVAFTGVAFTPENRAMDLHVSFTVWGWRIVALLALLLAVAAWRAGETYRRVARICAAAGTLLAGYVALFTWGPSGGTASSLMVHVVAQKAAAALVVMALIGLARVTPREAIMEQ